MLRADVADGAAVAAAVRGMDVVFHCAAKAGIWGALCEYRRVNVLGTRRVLDACLAAGVRRFVHTSSPSVVMDGRDLEGVNESLPYPSSYKANYPRTKAEAEKLALGANSSAIAVVALRPHLIWGPGDNHFLPRLVSRARAGKLRRFSGPPKLVDTTYIDDAARAHLLAADRLRIGSAISGKAYFISQGQPLPLWDIIDRLLATAGVGPLNKQVPPRLAYAAGSLLEIIYTAFACDTEPPITRFLAEELSSAHWFDLSAARRDLGYQPSCTFDEGLKRLTDWLRRDGR